MPSTRPRGKGQASDLAGLQSAVNDASSRTTILWISFLTFMAYLTMTVGAVNHETLLRESPIELPLLKVQLPLVAFFAIAPIFLLLFHFYLLLQLAILAQKAFRYEGELKHNFADDENRQELERHRFDTFMVLQMICGPKEERDGMTAKLLNVMAMTTLVIAPILILIQFQLSFLPYHHSWVTWWHRGAILVDLRLVWVFWRSIRLKNGEIIFPEINFSFWKLRQPLPYIRAVSLGLRETLAKEKFAFFASAFLVFFTFFAISYRGEWISRVIVLPIGSAGEWTTLSDLLFHGPINMVEGRPRSIFSNVLVVPYKALAREDDDWNTDYPSLSFRGRDLQGAVLIGTNLTGADFTGANLNDAHFDDAKLTGARFRCGTDEKSNISRWPVDGCTWLQRASFIRAKLQAADFTRARMYGAILIEAHLEGALFIETELQASVLTRANLDGARLKYALLNYAYLNDAHFVGASIEGVDFRRALIAGATFDIAIMKKVIIRGSKGTPGTRGAPGTQETPGPCDPRDQDAGPCGFSYTNIHEQDWVPSDKDQHNEFDPEKFNKAPAEVLEFMTPEYRYLYSTVYNKSAMEEDTKWDGLLASQRKAQGDGATRTRDLKAFRYLYSLTCDPGSAPFVTHALFESGRIGEMFDKVLNWLAVPQSSPDLNLPPGTDPLYEEASGWIKAFLNSQNCRGARGLGEVYLTMLIQYRSHLDSIKRARPMAERNERASAEREGDFAKSDQR